MKSQNNNPVGMVHIVATDFNPLEMKNNPLEMNNNLLEMKNNPLEMKNNNDIGE